MTETLNVFLNDSLIGTLTCNRGKLSFSYEEAYLSRRGAIPLSNSLPLGATVYRHKAVSAYFSNLLPDGDIRKKIARILHLSASNTFQLLREIGEDCAGAVTLYAPNRDSRVECEPIYRPLSDSEAAEILGNLDCQPLNIKSDDLDYRLSGAGAQNKLIACVEDGKIFLPLRGTPSTHIIKPGIPDLPESVFNELFCMRLAARCGIPAAQCRIYRWNDVPYYVVSRYDRQRNAAGQFRRIHQEDFGQALQVEPDRKYENEGGPGIADCVGLIAQLRLRAVDMLTFLRLVIFNFLIGNGDAHAKNFSVLYTDTQAQLAPAYDLISTAVYENLSRNMAMRIGEQYSFERITQGNFVRLGERLNASYGLNVQKILSTELNKMLQTLLPEAEKLAEELNREEPSDIYAKIVVGIHRRRNKLASSDSGSVLS